MLTILLALKLGEKTVASWLSRYGVRPALSIRRKLHEITFETECKTLRLQVCQWYRLCDETHCHTPSWIFGKTSIGFLFLIIRANHLIWTEQKVMGLFVQTVLDNYMKSRRKMKLSVGLETLGFKDGSLEIFSKTSRLDLDPNPSVSEAVTTVTLT